MGGFKLGIVIRKDSIPICSHAGGQEKKGNFSKTMLKNILGSENDKALNII